MIDNKKPIGMTADHGGYAMKEFVAGYLLGLGYAIKDYGCSSCDSVDYPEFGHLLAAGVQDGEVGLSFAFCGSANGMAITLNRHSGVRAAICWQSELASLAREHNDANICVIPGRFIDEVECSKVVDAFLAMEFAGGRHIARIEKIEL